MVSEKYRNFYRNKRSSLDGLAVHEHISNNLWISSILISFPSFLLGYSIVSFNPCLATGENNNGSACFDGSDTSCPPGSVYNDINLSTSK